MCELLSGIAFALLVFWLVFRPYKLHWDWETTMEYDKEGRLIRMSTKDRDKK